MCCLCGRSDSFTRMIDLVDRAIGITSGVLNRASHEPDIRGEANRFGYYFRGVPKALLQVGANGQLRGRDDVRCVCQRD